MTPNKLPPLPELIDKIIAGCATYTVVHPNGSRLKEVTVKESVWDEFVHASEALRQSQSLPAGAVAGLVGKWRGEIAAYDAKPDYSDPEDWMAGHRQCADELEQALQADAREKGEAVGELDRSAPPKVWLQIDTDGDNDDRSEAMPRDAWDHLSWHYEPIGGQEVVYIRADLATQPAQASEPPVRGFNTDRRMAAVEMLLSRGWKWEDGAWSEPHPQPVTPAGVEVEPFGYFDSQGLSHAGNSTTFRWLLEQHREGKPNWGDLKLLYTHPQPVTPAGGDVEDRCVAVAIAQSTHHEAGESAGSAWRRLVRAVMAEAHQPVAVEVVGWNEALGAIGRALPGTSSVEEVAQVVSDLERLGREEGWLCASLGANIIKQSHPPVADAALVLPGKIEPSDWNGGSDAYNRGWNECRARVAALNQRGGDK